ncbi:MAG: amidohydrolase family protein [Pseudomonadota bacterium]
MPATLIENTTVFDATGSAERPDAIAFTDTVEAVGPTAIAWAEGRNDVTRIDGAGLTVMPGLIDAHCHISFDEPHSNDELFFHRREGLAAIVAAHNVRKVLRAGVTSMFDADTIFKVSLDLRDAIEAGIAEGPRMLCGGNALFTSVGGTAGMLVPDEGSIGYLQVTRSKDEIVQAVRQQAKYGVDWIKVHVTGLIPRQRGEGEIQVWNFEELKLVVDTAHDIGLPVVGHCRNAASTRDAAKAGFDMILHATFMDEAAIDAVVEHKPSLVPTLTFQAVLADHGDKIGASPYLQDLFAKEIEGSSIQLKRAYDEGVPILCGTESGFSITPYGEWHWRELQVLTDNMGLTPEEALICATREGARAMKAYGELGTLETGKPADVIAVKGDVTKDVTLLGQPGAIEHIFKGGTSIDLSTPLPERKPLPSWRVSQYSTQPATRHRALGWAP